MRDVKLCCGNVNMFSPLNHSGYCMYQYFNKNIKYYLDQAIKGQTCYNS